MKKIYQRIDDPKHGDCYKCVIASILDLEYEDVPHFVDMGEDWLLEAQKFFREHGYDYSGKELHNPYEVVKDGRVSDDGKSYCYATHFSTSVGRVWVVTRPYRKSDCFLVVKHKAEKGD